MAGKRRTALARLGRLRLISRHALRIFLSYLTPPYSLTNPKPFIICT